MFETTKIFCAIDTASLDHACDLARVIAPVTGGIKLGLEFFNAFGPQGVEKVLNAAPDAQLFLDMKYHDIPNTVAGAVRAMCKNFAPAYLNVHASGGLEMMQAARDACPAQTKLLAVTILTSLNDNAVRNIGYEQPVEPMVYKMADAAQKAGLDGIVCSAKEIHTARDACGDDFVLMVPGIRPVGSAQGDQKRVMTPKEAMDAGATHLVIGRPITGADDPARAAQEILQSL